MPCDRPSSQLVAQERAALAELEDAEARLSEVEATSTHRILANGKSVLNREQEWQTGQMTSAMMKASLLFSLQATVVF